MFFINDIEKLKQTQKTKQFFINDIEKLKQIKRKNGCLVKYKK